MLDKKCPIGPRTFAKTYNSTAFAPNENRKLLRRSRSSLMRRTMEAMLAARAASEQGSSRRSRVGMSPIGPSCASSSPARSGRKKLVAANALGQGQERDLAAARAVSRPVPKSDRTYATLFACSARIPGFAAIAVLSLALGTGANTAIFQLIDSLRLRTLPVSNPQQLADVRILDTSWRHGRVHGRYPRHHHTRNGRQIRDHQRVFSSMLAWATEGGFNLAPSGEARYASGIWVSGRFFQDAGSPRTARPHLDRGG